MTDEKCILVVDDDPDIRDVVSWMLEDEGYAVQVAKNGREALDIATTQRPDVILLDLQMPVMDGWAFVRKCRAKQVCEDVPIVVMSAGHRIAEATTLGATDFLAKPFDVERLLSVLADVL